jgi:manganese/zinc/iron transport system substrate-binding protein
MRILLSLFLVLGLAGCSDSAPSSNAQIVTTTGMIADAVKNIVGDKLAVRPLMGAGVDPHLYKATQGDISRLTSADLVFYNGLHLEGKMSDLLQALGKKKPVVAVSTKLPEDQLIRHGDVHDPHVWFDIALWSHAVEQVRDALMAHYPQYASEFSTNAKHYLGQLAELDTWARDEIQSIPQKQRVLITAHDAFNYFGKAYGIEVKGLQGISTVSEIGVYDVTQMTELVKSRGIKALFVESSVSPRFVQAVQKGLEAQGYAVKIGGSLYSDAMGLEGTPEGSYIGMVRANVNTIVGNLK